MLVHQWKVSPSGFPLCCLSVSQCWLKMENHLEGLKVEKQQGVCYFEEETPARCYIAERILFVGAVSHLSGLLMDWLTSGLLLLLQQRQKTTMHSCGQFAECHTSFTLQNFTRLFVNLFVHNGKRVKCRTSLYSFSNSPHISFIHSFWHICKVGSKKRTDNPSHVRAAIAQVSWKKKKKNSQQPSPTPLLHISECHVFIQHTHTVGVETEHLIFHLLIWTKDYFLFFSVEYHLNLVNKKEMLLSEFPFNPLLSQKH